MTNAELSTPKWFRDAIAAPYEDGATEVRGCQVHYLRWGTRGRPGLVLVHGGAAHAHWWSFIAPLLAAEYRVVGARPVRPRRQRTAQRLSARDLGARGDGRRRARRLRRRADRGRPQHGRLRHDHRGRRLRRAARRRRDPRLAGAPAAIPRRRKARTARPSATRSSTRTSRPRSTTSAPCPTSRRRCPTSSTTSRATRCASSAAAITWKFDPLIFRRVTPRAIARGAARRCAAASRSSAASTGS